jgi:glycosyltransferase involved in cell wall biosynthesis
MTHLETFEERNSLSVHRAPLLSVIVPVYRGEHFLDELVERVKSSVQSIGVSLELVLIEDGGPDNSWKRLQELQQLHPEVVAAQLSRNFGQHKAITAGLSLANGDWIVVMDCDLQDRPEEIPNLFRTTTEGWEVVLARRVARQDKFLKRACSRAFSWTLGYLTATRQDPTVANFGIYKRSVIEAVLAMPDSFRCFPVMVRWVGFRTTAIDVEHASRSIGESSYSFSSALNLALDTILAFSDRPLRITLKIGMLLSISACCSALAIIFMAIRGSFTQAGWASIIVSIWFFSGLIISLLGCIGLYVGKAYEQSKNRPIFVIREILSTRDEH